MANAVNDWTAYVYRYVSPGVRLKTVKALASHSCDASDTNCHCFRYPGKRGRLLLLDSRCALAGKCYGRFKAYIERLGTVLSCLTAIGST